MAILFHNPIEVKKDEQGKKHIRAHSPIEKVNKSDIKTDSNTHTEIETRPIVKETKEGHNGKEATVQWPFKKEEVANKDDKTEYTVKNPVDTKDTKNGKQINIESPIEKKRPR